MSETAKALALLSHEDPRTARAVLTELLWELHGAAMDASNDPTRENLRAVDKAFSKAKRHLPNYYYEMSHPQSEA